MTGPRHRRPSRNRWPASASGRWQVRAYQQAIFVGAVPCRVIVVMLAQCQCGGLFVSCKHEACPYPWFVLLLLYVHFIYSVLI
ncbi:hypothetical protein BDA96_10G113400 [Sorghum bicolor]|uniref:Uncharacterized protein n=1 Tax=Sorghum bicolor TaxID=4558 RepID=A0A921U0M6_SORBI|nr:hypothetical protein BDA96_10G113400 [Sorghum bicolor]